MQIVYYHDDEALRLRGLIVRDVALDGRRQCNRRHIGRTVPGDLLERRHALRLFSIEQREVRPLQAAHRIPVLVDDDHVDFHEIDPCAKGWRLRVLGDERRHDHEQRERFGMGPRI